MDSITKYDRTWILENRFGVDSAAVYHSQVPVWGRKLVLLPVDDGSSPVCPVLKSSKIFYLF